jgi:hypothetical protein
LHKLKVDPGEVFHREHPDLSAASAGTQKLFDDAWRRLKDSFKLSDFDDYLDHILETDAGQARLVGDWYWKPLTFPASGGTVQSARFWDYQFCNKSETRAWLFERSHGDRYDHDLAEAEIEWVMDKEENMTSLLKREPTPDSGGPAEWFIRAGNFITLAELFHEGRKTLTCFHLYKIWLALPVWIHKREHS